MISVIIPALNSASTIEECLEAVTSQKNLDVDYEVIVVDDGSADNTAQLVSRFNVKLIQQAHAGAGAARNRGVQESNGDIIAFTDADCVVDAEWLHCLTKPFEDKDVVGVRGTYRTKQSSLVARFVQLEYEHKYRRPSMQGQIDFIDTYSAAYRRDIFLQNEGFDPTYQRLEDQEFSFRLARKGYKMVYEPTAIVYHYHNTSVKDYFYRKYLIGYWKVHILKNLPEKTFKDSHTPGSQRIQIVLLGLIGLSALFSIFYSQFIWLFLISLILFYSSGLSFLSYIARRDRKVLTISPVLLLIRAISQSLGIAFGIVFPPRYQPRPSTALKSSARFVKRTIDVIFSIIGLVLSSPIILLAAIAIKLDSPGPIFYTQVRVGENGKLFKIIKLRTMVSDADQQVKDVIAENPLKGPVFKIPNDPRVTRVGRFLRRWSIDEFPQFWNILKGEMSIVGPRPEEIRIVALYTDEQRQRLAVKPGMTGPMQIDGRGTLDMDTRLALEIDYIKHYSLIKDFIIMIRTIPAIISGNGAF